MMFLKGQIAAKQGEKEERVLEHLNEAVQIRLGQLDVSTDEKSDPTWQGELCSYE